MNQFTFETKQKRFLIGFMILGLVCLGITFLIDDELHTRFWTNYLHNTVFVVGIAFTSLFTLTAFSTALAGWHTVMKRIWEAYSLFLIPGLILLLVLIIGVYGHWHHLYHWMDEEFVATDRILKGKASFLNKNWYGIGTLIIVGIWILFAYMIRKLSLEEDQSGTADYKQHNKTAVWSAIFLPIAGFSSAAVIWQWVMSIDAHWYSTMFAWYSTASWFVAGMAITILTLIYLKGKGYFGNVTEEHIHDLGKYMFAFSIFWAYLWFDQFMLIWYANNGEETIYFFTRREEYPVLFYGNLILNFVVPFFVLMRNSTKRKYGTLIFTSIIIIFGHWLDFFLMIKPGALHTAHEALSHGHEAAAHAAHFTLGFHFPGFLEIGTMLGFLAGFMYFAFSRMEKASLQPGNDPYLQESLHHHV